MRKEICLLPLLMAFFVPGHARASDCILRSGIGSYFYYDSKGNLLAYRLETEMPRSVVKLALLSKADLLPPAKGLERHRITVSGNKMNCVSDPDYGPKVGKESNRKILQSRNGAMELMIVVPRDISDDCVMRMGIGTYYYYDKSKNLLAYRPTFEIAKDAVQLAALKDSDVVAAEEPNKYDRHKISVAGKNLLCSFDPKYSLEINKKLLQEANGALERLPAAPEFRPAAAGGATSN